MVRRRITPSTSATPPDRIKSRFSSHRFKKFLDSLDDVQKGFVEANGFGNLLNVSEFSVPTDLLDWIMSHLIVGVSEFRCHDKSIKLTKLMIQRIFGLPPPGNVAIDFDNIPENISSEAASASAVYATDQRKVSIAHVIELCKADHEESSFMRSFMLVALSCLLCPGTQNSVDLKYLNFLMRHTEIRDFDWSGHILQCILQSVKKFQTAIFSCDENIRNGSFYYASCLPALSIIYMDFLDLHLDHLNGYQLSYDIPRICHVRKEDFSFIVDVDIVRSNERSRPSFGALSLRPISSTPYDLIVHEDVQVHDDVPGHDGEVHEEVEVPQAVQPQEDYLIATPVLGLEQSLCNQTAAATNDHAQVNNSVQVPSSYQDIVRKHCNLLAEELPFVCSDVPDGTGVLSVFSSRLSMFASEIFAFALSTEPSIIGTHSSVDRHNLPHVTTVPSAAPEIVTSTPIDNATSSFVSTVGEMDVDPTHSELNGSPDASSSHVEPMENENVFSHCSDLDPAVQNGISIAIAFAESTPVLHSVPHIELPNIPAADGKDHTGSGTIDKRKRKKRAAVIHDDNSSLHLKIDSFVDEFYKKYVTCDFFQNKNIDRFVEISGFYCGYESFRASFKARGHVRGDVMTLHTKAFNLNSNHLKDTRTSRNKIAFPSFLALFFPICVGEHWSLICVNELQKQLHMFSSLSYPTGDERDLLITTLVSNFESACRVANILDRPLSSYKKIFPPCPLQNNIFDCGIYVMMFMEYFDSKVLKQFDKVAVTQFRKIAAHRIADSPPNDIDISLLSKE
ncbi:unnamed protein product [Urochloa decumbens]|uniref:Ubiquitin-like protease family profile domain-containing protein n=1 Tax=Urochloa decumbens TaxID=240449 RepID=A0ABC9AXN3_9POAL